MTKRRVIQKQNKMEMWQVLLDGEMYEVQVTFKKMKTVRLRVVTGGQIRLSAPLRISRVWLEQFLREREEWILTHVDELKERGANTTKQAPLTTAERKAALDYLMPMVEQWYPVVAFHGVSMPHVTVRRMRSRYGSCSAGRGRITLASMLLDVPRECAEYVVLHELTHFLHPNHSRQFYAFIAQHMPDWQGREQLLKQTSKKLS